MRKNPPPFIVYMTYWSLKDPLTQSQSLPYLLRLAAKGYRFGLITWEQKGYRMPSEQRKQERKHLAEQGIQWYPLKYHKSPSIPATFYDILLGVLKGLQIAIVHRPAIYQGRTTVPSLVAWLLAGLTGKKFLYDADEYLSKETGEFSNRLARKLRITITKTMESVLAGKADGIVTLTKKLSQVLDEDQRVHCPKPIVIPCCVDLKRIRHLPDARQEIRSDLGLEGRNVFIYVGKFGGLYLARETLEYFNRISDEIRNSFLIILSTVNHELFHQAAREVGLEPERYLITSCTPEEVPRWLSAADIAFSILKSSFERSLSASPIKNGEYLACGLPIISTPDIGDYSTLIKEEDVGVIVDIFQENEIKDSIDRIRRILSGKKALHERCRQVAEENICLDRIGTTRYMQAYDYLAGDGETP